MRSYTLVFCHWRQANDIAYLIYNDRSVVYSDRNRNEVNSVNTSAFCRTSRRSLCNKPSNISTAINLLLSNAVFFLFQESVRNGIVTVYFYLAACNSSKPIKCLANVCNVCSASYLRRYISHWMLLSSKILVDRSSLSAIICGTWVMQCFGVTVVHFIGLFIWCVSVFSNVWASSI